MSKGVIVFIHGLGGSAKGTWGQFNSLIHADPNLGNYDVEFYEYPTSLFRLPFSRKHPRIQTLADALRTILRHKYPGHRPVVLVGHSLGGLIARHFIIEEILNESPLRVQKLLLYAVPLNGAGLAEIVKHISLRHRQLDQLCRGADLIDSLNKSWERLGVHRKVQTWYVVAGQDAVVDEDSARGVPWNDHVDVLIDRGHRSCVKPEGPTDLVYLVFRNFVLSAWSGSRSDTDVAPIEPLNLKEEPNAELVRITIDGARPEGGELRVPFTIWNRGNHSVRIVAIGTEQLRYKPQFQFITGERTRLRLNGNESSLFQGKTQTLGPDESEAFELRYDITRGDSHPTIVMSLRATFHTRDFEKLEALSHSLVVYESLKDRARVLDEESLFDEVSDYPFFSENIDLFFSYLEFRNHDSEFLNEKMLSVFRTTFEEIRKAALAAGRIDDANKAVELCSSIEESWVLYDEKGLPNPRFVSDLLNDANHLHVRFFGRDRNQFEDVRRAILELWDPLGIKLNRRRVDEYDDCVNDLYILLYRKKSDDEILDYLTKLEIGTGANSREELLPLVRRLREIDIQ